VITLLFVNPDLSASVYGHLVVVVLETNLNGTPVSTDESIEDNRIDDGFERFQLLDIRTSQF
jgi:hypothetical protein